MIATIQTGADHQEEVKESSEDMGEEEDPDLQEQLE